MQKYNKLYKKIVFLIKIYEFLPQFTLYKIKYFINY